MQIYLNHNPETLQKYDMGKICKGIMIDKFALRNDCHGWIEGEWMINDDIDSQREA